MTRPAPLRTRRGLAFAFFGDLAVLLGVLGFLLTFRISLLVLGFVIGGLFALPSLSAMMRGRYELGPSHARLSAWALAAFISGALAFAFTFLGLSTTFPEEGKLATLRIALFLIGFALVAESGSGLLFLWHASDSRNRRILAVQGLLIALLLGPYFWRGVDRVNDFVRRSGGVAVIPAEAASYLHDFNTTVVRDFAVIFLVTRLVGMVALWRSINRLALAEHAEGAGASVSV